MTITPLFPRIWYSSSSYLQRQRSKVRVPSVAARTFFIQTYDMDGLSRSRSLWIFSGFFPSFILRISAHR